MNLMIVPGMFVCSSFLISVCMFIVSKALIISSATVIVHAGVELQQHLHMLCISLFHGFYALSHNILYRYRLAICLFC